MFTKKLLLQFLSIIVLVSVLSSFAMATSGRDLSLKELGQFCGVNCVYLIGSYFGKTMDYEKLRSELKSESEALDMFTLKNYCDGLGWSSEVFEVAPARLLSLQYPAILLQHPSKGVGHYSVIIPEGSDSIWQLDPPSSERRLTKSDLSQWDCKSMKWYVLVITSVDTPKPSSSKSSQPASQK
jgi:ABC-type bacteriocin/lantibiotic exporter with double-glycine peptidase domain